MKEKLVTLTFVCLIFLGSYAQTQRATVASGNWSSTSTWSGGVVPSSSETAVISAGHTVTYDLSTGTFAGVNINGELDMTASGNHELKSSKNIVVKGKLVATASSYSNYQKIQFISINENNFVGATDTVISSDVGLWVVDTGQVNLDGRISGGRKTYSVHASGSITNGQTTISIDQTPANWKSGDDILIAPTQSPSVGDDFVLGFDSTKLSADVSTASISLVAGTGFPHPKINSTWGAEILNLTRPIRIEGTSTGHTHVFIKSSKVQMIRDVAFRYMGPRKDINADGVPELVQGRYGLHFHHCDDASRGSIVENCVMRDNTNHSYVPHSSHGITFKKNIAFNVLETAFWWDLGHPTHDILWDSNTVVFAMYVPQSIALPFEEESPTFCANGFEMGIGDGNIATNNVAIATVGEASIGGGFDWEADNEGVWTFKNNLAHNCQNGLRVWQNTTKNHVIENYTCYNSLNSIFHGAYANSYRYITGTLYNAPVEIEAGSTHSSRIRFENYTIDAQGADYGVQMVTSPLPGTMPVLFRNCTVTNAAVAGIIDQCTTNIHSVDIIQSTGTFTVDAGAGPGEKMRIQPTSGQAVQKTYAGSTNISNFAPTVWGDGTGLNGEYYGNTDFTNLLFARVDSYVGFSEWENGVHYSITDNTYSVRWTGQFQPQFTEKYQFKLGIGGGYKLWIRDTLRLNSWTEHYPTGDSTGAADSVFLVAGTKYNIKLEYFNSDAHTGVNLYWNSPSINKFSPGGEYIPQSQLWPTGYTGSRIAAPPPPPKYVTKKGILPVEQFIVSTFVRDRIIVRSSKEAVYEVYDMSGRILGRGTVVRGVNYLPAGNTTSGMMILRLDHDAIYKLVKE